MFHIAVHSEGKCIFINFLVITFDPLFFLNVKAEAVRSYIISRGLKANNFWTLVWTIVGLIAMVKSFHIISLSPLGTPKLDNLLLISSLFHFVFRKEVVLTLAARFIFNLCQIPLPLLHTSAKKSRLQLYRVTTNFFCSTDFHPFLLCLLCWRKNFRSCQQCQYQSVLH